MGNKGCYVIKSDINSLPNDKILDLSKLKVFADDKIIATQKLKFVLERIENIVGKQENATNQIESICRRQNYYDSKIEICFGNSREHCGEKGKTVIKLVCPYTTQSRLLTFLRKNTFEDIVGKGENACCQHTCVR